MIVLSWSTWIIPNANQTIFYKHDLPELAGSLHLPGTFCYSQRQIEENHKDVNGEGISKNKEKLISHLNLNLVVLHDSSFPPSAARFYIVCATDKRKVLFKINGIG